MNNDWDKIEADKRALRARYTAMPISEKLKMLDALRERTLVIQRASLRLPEKDNPDTPEH
ncbi:MAG TPA: hypothetical protein VGL56_16385 [Fimbriimonadaceae bacterium]|jgi:hypothetical protein